MASRTTDSEGEPPTERAPRAGIDFGSSLRDWPTSNPARGVYALIQGWGILVIGSEEKTVIRGNKALTLGLRPVAAPAPHHRWEGLVFRGPSVKGQAIVALSQRRSRHQQVLL